MIIYMHKHHFTTHYIIPLQSACKRRAIKMDDCIMLAIVVDAVDNIYLIAFFVS